MNTNIPLFAIGLGTNEAIIIFVLVLVLFGGSKIPQLMRGIGQGVGELQKGLEEGRRAIETSARETTTSVPAEEKKSLDQG